MTLNLGHKIYFKNASQRVHFDHQILLSHNGPIYLTHFFGHLKSAGVDEGGRCGRKGERGEAKLVGNIVIESHLSPSHFHTKQRIVLLAAV